MNTNKYQEALEHFKSYKDIITHSRFPNRRFNKDVDKLQELIDKQECFELYFSENHKKQFNEFYERWKKGYE